MKYLIDFDFGLKYHLEKANAVADALSMKTLLRAELMIHMCNLHERFRDLNLDVTKVESGILFHKLEITCNLRSRIARAQELDSDLKRRMGQPEFTLAPDGTILFEGRIYDTESKRLILEEAHKSNFSIHPDATKMYYDLTKTIDVPK
jgi:hypothetical protein